MCPGTMFQQSIFGRHLVSKGRDDWRVTQKHEADHMAYSVMRTFRLLLSFSTCFNSSVETEGALTLTTGFFLAILLI
jgi:hypothetical protein